MESIADVIAVRRMRLATRSGYWSLLVRVLIVAAVGYLFATRLFLITQVSGMDMFSALKDGDLAIVFRLQQEYAKDDVVAYETTEGLRFGRIIARESDVVMMDDTGTLTVNGTVQSGEILYPTYALEGIEYPYRVPEGLEFPQIVPEGCVFVLGDYRTRATDSRTLGAISMDEVSGKVITILRRRGL